MTKSDYNRLLNAATFFSRSVSNSNDIKVYKLLKKFDSEHVEQIGGSVFGEKWNGAFCISKKANFCCDDFTPRQLQLMVALAEKYEDVDLAF